MSYDTTVEGYLKRCKKHRDAGGLQDLLYAALELRMGVETRLAESVQAVDGLTVRSAVSGGSYISQARFRRSSGAMGMTF